jgi:hypothetical protein
MRDVRRRGAGVSQFDAFFALIVEEKRADLTVGTLEALDAHGRRRWVPFFRRQELADSQRKRLEVL